jgi:DNA-directed RNA polymerase subunit RPC12/RpoP
MAEKVVTTRICDYHALDDVEVEAEQLPAFPVKGRRADTVDLCKDCRTDYYDPLADVLEAIANSRRGHRQQQPKSTKPQPKVVELPTHKCDECSRTFNTAQGLHSHETRVHHKRNGSSNGTAVKEHKCPDCGSKFATKQGLGAHRARSHGYRRAEAENTRSLSL